MLLDEDFNSKLSDFGLARHGPQEGYSYVSTAVRRCSHLLLSSHSLVDLELICNDVQRTKVISVT